MLIYWNIFNEKKRIYIVVEFYNCYINLYEIKIDIFGMLK